MTRAKKPQRHTFRSSSPAATKKFARLFARNLAAHGPRGACATVVGLTGDLGSGKTTFTQAFARSLGVRGNLTSPTFIIMKRYPLRRSNFYMNLYHVDAYRIRKSAELRAVGMKRVLADRRNIVLVEWAENVKEALPRGAVHVRFRHGEKKNERAITVR